MQEYPLVSIQCLVYNHEPYLRQCLDGFVMQKTNFKFEAIVHDDKSTDGSAKIIAEYAEKYPEIIRPIYETENQYSKRDGSLERIVNQACRGKYIALCEGDDYWTDPMKLQKQVDFMEAHPEYSMCFGDAEYYDVSLGKLDRKINDKFRAVNDSLTSSMPSEVFSKIIKGQCLIRTLCVLYRKECLEAIEPNQYTFMMGDVPLWLDLSQKGKVHFLKDIFGVYNMHANSVTHDQQSILRFKLSMYEMRVYYLYKYDYQIPDSIRLRYNFSYYDYMLLSSSVNNYKPIFPPFKINVVFDKLSMYIRQTGLYRTLLIKKSKLISYVRLAVIKLFDKNS